RRDYAPGESGEMRVIFTVDGRTGPQEKTVTVATNLPEQPLLEIKFQTDIPDAVRLEPQVVQWEQNATTPKPEIIVITLADGVPLEKLDVGIGGTAFRTTLRTIELGRRYELEVVPAEGGTAQFAREEILVVARLTENRTLRCNAFALVR